MGDISPTLYDRNGFVHGGFSPQLMADEDVKPTINLMRICGLNVAFSWNIFMSNSI
jgi:hypothetical protein